MKLLVDGYALGAQHGTGLTRYSIETVHTLKQMGHSVDLLLGAAATRANAKVLPSVVLQKLMADPPRSLFDTPVSELFEIALAMVRHSLSPLGVAADSARPVAFDQAFISADSVVDFDDFAAIYNSNEIYRAAFVSASVTGKNLVIKPPHGAESPDLFHCTSPLPVAMKAIPRVTTVHDLIPLTFPQATKIPLRRYHQIMRAAIADSAMLCCVSEHSANELTKFFAVPESRIAVTYQSVDLTSYVELLTDSFVSTVLGEYGLEHGGYLLFNGAVEPKKNVDRLLDAYAQSAVTLPLVVLGPSGWMCEAVEDRIQCAGKSGSQKVIRIGFLERLSQLAIIKGAAALCFPSLAEGFGLPVLEAMSLGTPVITSDKPALKELVGDAALTVNPYSTVSIAAAIRNVVNDNRASAELSLQGIERSGRFSSEQYQLRLQAAYEAALGVA